MRKEEVAGFASVPTPGAFTKAYAIIVEQSRLHHAEFRKTILAAYDDQCASASRTARNGGSSALHVANQRWLPVPPRTSR